jgi:hypothetical protein
MKATPVIGVSAATGGVPKMRLRAQACSAKPESHAATSGSRPVNFAFRKVPVQMMRPGSTRSPAAPKCSVNW